MVIVIILSDDVVNVSCLSDCNDVIEDCNVVIELPIGFETSLKYPNCVVVMSDTATLPDESLINALFTDKLLLVIVVAPPVMVVCLLLILFSINVSDMYILALSSLSKFG